MSNEKELPKETSNKIEPDQLEQTSGGRDSAKKLLASEIPLYTGKMTTTTYIVHGRKSGKQNDNEELWNVYEVLGWDGDYRAMPHIDEIPYGRPLLKGSFSTKEEAVKASGLDNPEIRETSYPLDNMNFFTFPWIYGS